jgi:hypothetical protein
MSESKKGLYAVGAIACAALVTSVAGLVRGRSSPAQAAAPASASACVDAEARASLERVWGAMGQREAAQAKGPVGSLLPGAPPPWGADSSAVPQRKPHKGPMRFVSFKVPNPALTVVQREDGVIDAKTTDPTLAGTIVQVTATDIDGRELPLLVKVPQ